jgi:aminoglycoside/choline kinase family phosphotransferase
MERIQRIETWLSGLWPSTSFTLAPASADASFRRYFRVSRPGKDSLIVMDAPPSHENVGPWLQVQRLFHDAGVHVPEVLATNLEEGFLLLSDLGTTTYLSALTPDRVAAIPGDYLEAIDALIKIQAASRPDVLPPYDRALLQRELELFPDWYIGRHLNLPLDDKQRQTLAQTFDQIIAVNLAEPRVFVHRDYHSRNLMLIEGGANPGIIDFQDAVYGPISYDLVSLLKDAYVDWDEEIALDWLVRYWERAKKAGLPVRPDFAEFHRDYEWMGVQRHLKVLGIFARLCHRDGKDGYLKDMPLVAKYLRRAVERYDELTPLRKLLDQLEDKITVLGHTMEKAALHARQYD